MDKHQTPDLLSSQPLRLLANHVHDLRRLWFAEHEQNKRLKAALLEAKEILMNEAKENSVNELISHIEKEIKNPKSLNTSFQTCTEASFSFNRKSPMLCYTLNSLKKSRLSSSFHRILCESKVKKVKDHAISLLSEVYSRMKAKKLSSFLKGAYKSRIQHSFIKIQYTLWPNKDPLITEEKPKDYKIHEKAFSDASAKLSSFLEKHEKNYYNYSLERIKEKWETRLVIEEGIDILVPIVTRISKPIKNLVFNSIKNSMPIIAPSKIDENSSNLLCSEDLALTLPSKSSTPFEAIKDSSNKENENFLLSQNFRKKGLKRVNINIPQLAATHCLYNN
ncbi:unnamed protein product [Blepharisma stoltei]|uniref:Uncharacterized protein n=1 Tax=Blepharisma stoltei TaxID=1481888 RepID=A0AAU9J4B6_9CILI|nr:unnamed protein product [Blepharisma stoltei]